MTSVLEAAFEATGCNDPAQREKITAILARAGLLSEPEAPASRMETDDSLDIIMLDPSVIKTDPALYQFRSGGDACGVTNKACLEADRWDPVIHGDPLLVHEQLDGSLYVVDGHHRLALANKLSLEGKGPNMLPAIVLRESKGYTAHDAKIIAAFKNLAHDHAPAHLDETQIEASHKKLADAARVLQEAKLVPEEMLPKLPMQKGYLPLASALSTLPPESLGLVQEGSVSVKEGLEVIKRVRAPEQQNAVMSILAKNHHSHSQREKDRREQASPSLAI